MNSTVTDEQIRELASTAQPYSLVLLSWTPQRHQDGAEAIELEHQRRMVSLRADGVIAILCPILSDTLAGMAVMPATENHARQIMADDPCVQAGMMTYQTYSCLGFPGDSLPV
ncbi:hypothetical protein FOS14_12440 [Skermania sp. ID1734]|uniref:hypothetical protein n=1 Tax=Skermania sp. ID1734 TaxID=2597516 RepID=UPI00117F3222|nr:hypothetical protein [Skermania sp. ID1734]TSD99568.1 hypothetical protein FOS14_12440 [Skermania sp. ID1734]